MPALPPTLMWVGSAILEIHIPGAESLKDKRMVVRSLRDRIRRRFGVSCAEVSQQELHQRARLGLAFVSPARKEVESTFEAVEGFVASSGDAELTGWAAEIESIDADGILRISQSIPINDLPWRNDEEDETDGESR